MIINSNNDSVKWPENNTKWTGVQKIHFMYTLLSEPIIIFGHCLTIVWARQSLTGQAKLTWHVTYTSKILVVLGIYKLLQAKPLQVAVNDKIHSPSANTIEHYH